MFNRQRTRARNQRRREFGLTQEECQILKDVITLHIDGQEVAREATLEDRSISEAETLLEVDAEIHREVSFLTRLKEVL